MKELLKRFGIAEQEFRRVVAKDLLAIAGTHNYEIEAIPGGASVRGYARVSLDGASRIPGLVLMVLSDPDPAKGVEEVMASGVIKELPFINVHRHLKRSGVSVPEIYRYNQERGLIYLEDCGVFHLRQAAESGDDRLKRECFEAALKELVKIHVDATGLGSDDFLGFKVVFDRKLLRWELDHFTEYAVRNRFPGALCAGDEQEIGRTFEWMVEELLGSPYALQHRDYMLDNLMVKDDKVMVLDFQDALMGPIAYDLACFLYDRDTSTLLGREMIEGLVEYYLDALAERKKEDVDRAAVRRCFELCVIHRLLKVVGRFHFIDQVKKRPEYLKFIPHMLPALSDYLGRMDETGPLLAIIRRLLQEMEG